MLRERETERDRDGDRETGRQRSQLVEITRKEKQRKQEILVLERQSN